MLDEELTTITLKKKTRDQFRKVGNKGESWDDLINRVLDEHEKNIKVSEMRKDHIKKNIMILDEKMNNKTK